MMSVLLPVTETIVPLGCSKESRPRSFVGRRLRISMGELHKKVESIDHAVGIGAHIEVEIDEQWTDVYSILASRWAGSVSAYMTVHHGRRHVLSRVRALPEWLRSEMTFYFVSPERGGLSTDERTLELLDLAQAFPRHQFELIPEQDFLLASIEARLRDGVLLRISEGPQKRETQSVFAGSILGLAPFQRSLIRQLSSWWLKPLTYLMLLTVLILYSLSSLLDRIFVGGLNLAQEAYARARRSEHGRVKSGAIAALAAAHGLKRHPIVGQARELRWQAEEVKWRVYDLKRHFWVHHAPVPWLKVYVPPAYGAIEISKTAYWQAHRWYWRLFHWVSESRGRARVLPTLMYWRMYHWVSESRGRVRVLPELVYWQGYHWVMEARGRCQAIGAQFYWSTYRFFTRAYWACHTTWYLLRYKCVHLMWILRHPWSCLEGRVPWLKAVKATVLKPYYFSKYQWEKRVLGLQLRQKVKS